MDTNFTGTHRSSDPPESLVSRQPQKWSNPPQANDGSGDLENFASLFSTDTETPMASAKPISAKPRPGSRIYEPSSTPSDSGSEFGSFVSVSVPFAEDPLTAEAFGLKSDLPIERSTPANASASNVDPERTNTPMLHVSVPRTGIDGPQQTRSFFDKIAQDARANSETRERGILDELLMHEDDPFWWLKGGDAPTSMPAPKPSNPSATASYPGQDDDLLSEGGVTPTPQHQHHSTPRAPSDPFTRVRSPIDDLMDLDQNFFTSKPHPTSHLQQNDAHAHVHEMHHPRPHLESPSRSSTLALPVHLAPPLADTSNIIASASPPTDMDPLSYFQSQSKEKINVKPSSSHSTFSTLSSRWMPSFLKSPPPSSSSHTHGHLPPSRPSLESIFGSDLKRASSHDRTRSSSPSRAPLHRTSSHPDPHLHFGTIPVSDVNISHGNPFARPSSTSLNSTTRSPFAAHTYTPPTGAPGYQGERYDWDKGFSDDLVREMVVPTSGHQENRLPTKGGANGNAMGRLKGKGKAKAKMEPDVAQVIEKKTGNVHLEGRKGSTAPVLDVRLANLIRAHLSPLARLPHTWTLIYSLDQHGISLNTLYDLCEKAATPRRGMSLAAGQLAIIRPTAGAVQEKEATVFGVYMGKEGIRMSRGKGYMGSGDSFLWRFIDGKLDVYKWTGRNDYVALCEPEFISFGGGDGNYGLYLDDTLFEGSSAPCPTFDNEPLCRSSSVPIKASESDRAGTGAVKFECEGMEVWAVGP